MNKREINLKLLLDELGISSSPANRRGVQETVYAQSVHGLDLGYMFGDYPVGKYSPELWDTHKMLCNSLECGDTEYREYRLTVAALGRVWRGRR